MNDQLETKLPEPALHEIEVPDSSPTFVSTLSRQFHDTVNRRELAKPELLVAELGHVVDHFSGLIKKSLESQGKDIDDIETFLDGIFGPLRLPKEVLTPKYGEKLSVADRELSARVGQTQAHYLLYAMSGQSSPEFRRVMTDVALMMESLGSSRLYSFTDFGNLWRGIKGQVGLMKAMSSLGYTIHQPSYRLTDSIMDNPAHLSNEVRYWDVLGGIDFIAVSPHDNQPLLVDSKSRANEQIGHDKFVRKLPEIIEDDGKFGNSVASFLRSRSLNPEAAKRAKIIFPTSANIGDKNGLNDIFELPRDALNHLRSLLVEFESNTLPVRNDSVIVA